MPPSTVKPTEKPYRLGVFIGALLASGPLWGFLVTVYGMFRSFGTLGNNGLADHQALAHNVGLSLRGTAVGLAVCPIGVVVLILSLALRTRARHRSPPPLPTTFSS